MTYERLMHYRDGAGVERDGTVHNRQHGTHDAMMMMMMRIGNQGRSTRSVTKNVPATMAFVAVALHGALKCNRRRGGGDEGEFASAAAKRVVLPSSPAAPATDPMP